MTEKFTKMQEVQKTNSRKKFILLGVTALSSLGMMKVFNVLKKKKPETVRMLSQDGKLVEIPQALLSKASARKISDKELQQWIKNK